MAISENYFKYLDTRSILGYAYRRFYLYPRVAAYLKGNVLDIGCGLGQFVSYRKNTLGVDINEKCVDYCKNLNLNVECIQDPPWQFENGQFDGVVLDNVLEHISEPEQTLREIHRILKTQGVLVVGVPGVKGFAHDADHKVFYDAELLGNLLKKYDFQLVRYFYTPFKSDFLNSTMKQYCLFGVFTKN